MSTERPDHLHSDPTVAEDEQGTVATGDGAEKTRTDVTTDPATRRIGGGAQEIVAQKIESQEIEPTFTDFELPEEVTAPLTIEAGESRVADPSYDEPSGTRKVEPIPYEVSGGSVPTKPAAPPTDPRAGRSASFEPKSAPAAHTPIDPGRSFTQRPTPWLNGREKTVLLAAGAVGAGVMLGSYLLGLLG